MKKSIGIVIGIILLLVLVGVSFFSGKYNSLVELDEEIQLAQANVETNMQRRAELIPDLVSTVKSYAKHEETVYADIANARAALNDSIETGNPQAISEADNNLTKAVNKLLVIVEQYPELKAGDQYTSLMDQIEGSVNRISIAREKYNSAVSEYNRKIRKFPERIYASIFGFEKYDTFKAVEGADATNIVDFD